MNKTIRQQYRKNSKKSLCKSKTAKKCKKIKGCKHVSGKKRSFCRKIKNKRYNKTKKFKGGEQICSPTNLDPCTDAALIGINQKKNNSKEIEDAVWDDIIKRTKEHELAAAAKRNRRRNQKKGMEDKDKLNKDKREQLLADQKARLEQEKQARKERLERLERLKNLTNSNSTETESECSTTNSSSCTSKELSKINQNNEKTKSNSTKTHIPFPPEQECSPTNLDVCTTDKLEDIMMNPDIPTVIQSEAQKLLVKNLNFPPLTIIRGDNEKYRYRHNNY